MAQVPLSARDHQTCTAPAFATIPICMLTPSVEVLLVLYTQQVPSDLIINPCPPTPIDPNLHFPLISSFCSCPGLIFTPSLSGFSQMANLIGSLSFILSCLFPWPLPLLRPWSLCRDSYEGLLVSARTVWHLNSSTWLSEFLLILLSPP